MENTQADIFESIRYVSRGGQKLAKALDYFDISPQGKVCIDCGASTGGFTDCLLQRGARLVYAIDVGYGQFDWTLRNDPRVVVMERTNIRYVAPDMLKLPDNRKSPGGIDIKPVLSVIDVSFISLALVLPVIYTLMDCENTEAICQAVCLIKPQFEAGREKVGKKGVIRDPRTHEEVLHRFADHAAAAGFILQGITYSPVKGPKGNIEYLGYLASKGSCKPIDIEAIVAGSHKDLNL